MAFIMKYIIYLSTMAFFALWSWPSLAKVWQCTYEPLDAPKFSETQIFREDGGELIGEEDDYSGKPRRYRIVENAPYGLIAISHYSGQHSDGHNTMGIVLVIINKEDKTIKLLGTKYNSEFYDLYYGKCR